jgi:Zn-dependent membrane protease YugP
MFYFDPLYFIVVGPALLLSIWAQVKVQSTFKRFSQVATHSGLSGAEAAGRILQAFGAQQVEVQRTQGFLSDHYDPRKRVLRLSPPVFGGRSISSIGVAAHEAGHALQHAQGYFPLQIRTALVPITQLGSWLAWPLLLMGFLLSAAALIKLGILFFTGAVLFQLVTLPVEFDASKRAVAILGNQGILAGTELDGTRKVLSAAALTYVAGAAAAVLQLVYFLLRAGMLGGRDE